MGNLDRVVAGLRCRDVLGVLGDYVDGGLDATAEKQIIEHLRGCDACEKFGGEYAALVADLRRSIAAPLPKPDVRERLVARLEVAWTEEAE